MTRFEYLQNCSLEEAAKFLCDILDYSTPEGEVNLCDSCIASAVCKKGHTGFIDWLKEEK